MPVIADVTLFKNLISIAEDHRDHMKELQFENGRKTTIAQAHGDDDKAATFQGLHDEFRYIVENVQAVIDEAKPYLDDMGLSD